MGRPNEALALNWQGRGPAQRYIKTYSSALDMAVGAFPFLWRVEELAGWASAGVGMGDSWTFCFLDLRVVDCCSAAGGWEGLGSEAAGAFRFRDAARLRVDEVDWAAGERPAGAAAGAGDWPSGETAWPMAASRRAEERVCLEDMSICYDSRRLLQERDQEAGGDSGAEHGMKCRLRRGGRRRQEKMEGRGPTDADVQGG